MANALRALHAGQAWTEAGFTREQTIWLEEGRIAGLEPSPVPPTLDDGVLDAGDAIVVPGLVDLQVNGGLGWSFQAQDRAHFDEIVAYHGRRGTTTLLPTLITAAREMLLESLGALSRYLSSARGVYLPGIHLEGPFLAPSKSGAHDPEALREPDPTLTEAFIDAAAGQLSLFTLAPELPGALPLIEYLSQKGILVAAGHSAATHAQLVEAAAAGLGMVTHAGNASDWPHRAMGELGFMSSEPGVVGSLMALPDLAGSIIMDGYHFHPALLAPLVRLKGPDHIVLVSDASTVAGCPAGEYGGGGLEVTVDPRGFATSGRGGGWLAGSTITLLDGVQRAVDLAGVPLHQAVHMASLGPARLLGIADHKGDLRPGVDADLLVLNPDLSLRQVIVGGMLMAETPG